MGEQKNPAHEDLVRRLREGLHRQPEVKLITPDEYVAVREISSFSCPNGWTPAGCDGSNCPRQPDPCVKCTVTKLLDRARERHGVIPDDTFKKLIKRCDSCNEKASVMEEPTYYKKCMEARRARRVVSGVREGKIVVVNNGNGWAIPV